MVLTPAFKNANRYPHSQGLKGNYFAIDKGCPNLRPRRINVHECTFNIGLSALETEGTREKMERETILCENLLLFPFDEIRLLVPKRKLHRLPAIATVSSSQALVNSMVEKKMPFARTIRGAVINCIL